MLSGDLPQLQNSANGVIVRHSEYIQDIGPTNDFKANTYPLNPGMDQTFPWLSQIAMAFTEYKWRGCVFTYKTTSSDLVTSTNPSLGTVMMATDYNAVEEPFSDKRAMNNYEFTTSSKPSLSFMHGIECEKTQTANNILYTRDGKPPPNADIRLYDIGQFCIATQGMQSTALDATIGELWCTYEIEFLKPRFDVDAGLEFDVYTGNTVSTATRLLGDPGAWSNYGNLGGQLSSNDTTGYLRYEFPADSSDKTFQIWMTSSGATASVNNATTFATQQVFNCAHISSLLNQSNTTNLKQNEIFFLGYFRVGNVTSANQLPFIEWTWANTPVTDRLPTGVGYMNFTISEVNRDLPNLV